MAAGQIVPAFEILDATHKKVIDGGHGVSYYWVGKNKAATLFSATPAGPVRHGSLRLPRLAAGRRRPGAVRRVLPRRPQAQRRWHADRRLEPAGDGLVQAPDQGPRRLQGHEVPADRHRGRDLPAHGHDHRQHARRRDHPLGAAWRDRLRGVGRGRGGPAPRPAPGVEVPLHPGHARVELDARADRQHRRVEDASRRSSRRRGARRRWRPSCAGA